MAMNALQVAVTGIVAAQNAVQAHAHNLANLSTFGFKKSYAYTSDNFYSTLKKAGAVENAATGIRSPIGAQLGGGSKVNGVYRVVDVQQPVHTKQPLDIALTGPGYFAIAVPNYPNGRGYTRNGIFSLNADNAIVTRAGDLLDVDFVIPAGVTKDKVTISTNGTVSYQDAQQQQIEVGVIPLYNFANDNGLEAMGNDMLVETPASGEAFEVEEQDKKFTSEHLEASNVEAVQELTSMMNSQKAYNLCFRVIKIVDEMEKEVSNLK